MDSVGSMHQMCRLAILMGSFCLCAVTEGFPPEESRPNFDLETDTFCRVGSSPISDEVPNPWIIAEEVWLSSPIDLGHVIIVDGGVLNIQSVPEPGVRFSGNLWVTGSGRVKMAYSVIQFMNTYHGQYHLVGIDRADILVEGCTYRIPHGVQHGLVAAGNSSLTVRESNFGSVQLTASQSGFLDASRLNGHFEVIIQGDAEMRLADIPRTTDGGDLWVWTEHPSGSVADFSPPMPGFVPQWSFPPPGATGIDQRCTMTRCKTLLWPTLVYPGAEMFVHDIPEEHWVVIGFHMPESVTVSGVNNDEYVSDALLPLSDRTIHLKNAQVDTWNFYPEEDAHVVMKNCQFGEALTFQTSMLELYDCLVDGSGGYLGAQDQSTMMARRCRFTCDVQAIHEASMILDHCELAPYPLDPDGSYTRAGAYDDARMVLNQSPIGTTPALGGFGGMIITWLSDVTPWPPRNGEPASVSGSVALLALEDGPVLESWILEAYPSLAVDAKHAFDSGADAWRQIVAQGFDSVLDAHLGTWMPELPANAFLRFRWTITDSSGHTFTSEWPLEGSDMNQTLNETSFRIENPFEMIPKNERPVVRGVGTSFRDYDFIDFP